jgi:hypothetical protein
MPVNNSFTWRRTRALRSAAEFQLAVAAALLQISSEQDVSQLQSPSDDETCTTILLKE